MKVLIAATDDQKHEILNNKFLTGGAELHFVNHIEEKQNYKDFDAWFLLTGNLEVDFKNHFYKPIVINSVIDTLKSLKVPSNFCRINGWPGFLKRRIYEVAANNETEAASLFNGMGWDVLFVKDEPGLVAARVISMIINEAYFALDENISTIKEIDVAMKLGTNYPMGPFEWESKIGLKNVYKLLQKLSETEKRYQPAPALEQKFKSFTTS